MKRIILILVLGILLSNIQAQKATNSNRIFENQYYIDLTSKAVTIAGHWGLMGGLRAGYAISPNVRIGAVAYGLIPEHIESNYINSETRADTHLGYGGLEVMVNHALSKKFDLAGQLMIGAGRVDREDHNGNDYFFIIEPGVAANYYLVDWFGIGVGLNYRLASGVNYADFKKESLSGWGYTLDFKFGF